MFSAIFKVDFGLTSYFAVYRGFRGGGMSSGDPCSNVSICCPLKPVAVAQCSSVCVFKQAISPLKGAGVGPWSSRDLEMSQ